MTDPLPVPDTVLPWGHWVRSCPWGRARGCPECFLATPHPACCPSLSHPWSQTPEQGLASLRTAGASSQLTSSQPTPPQVLQHPPPPPWPPCRSSSALHQAHLPPTLILKQEPPKARKPGCRKHRVGLLRLPTAPLPPCPCLRSEARGTRAARPPGTEQAQDAQAACPQEVGCPLCTDKGSSTGAAPLPGLGPGQVSIRHHQADVKLEGAAVIWTIIVTIIASSP